ncbi:MAG: ribonuclease H-like domain-containing protein [Acidobacteria bacterium]|nr:ribonuclease H-like domain-containing protein [Acidobacteriota bacterium]
MSTDPNRLSSRLRELLRSTPAPAGAADRARPLHAGDLPADQPRELRYVADDGPPAPDHADTGCVIMERDYALHMAHGRHNVAHYADVLTRCLPALAILAGDFQAAGVTAPARAGRLEWDMRGRLAEDRRRTGAPTEGPLLFFDLETTGLSGGAGTLAFLVGCGYFEGDTFRTRQYFLAGYEAEHELLLALAGLARQFRGLVTFNGRTFDVPLIETRYLFHRLESPFGGMPHFDMLHPARKLWRRRGAASASHRDRWSDGRPGDAASCALGALEEAILGVQRLDDVPGFEIPSRYFSYLRTGALEPLQGVFEHNRLDLLSLAALTAVAAQMADEGPTAVPSPHEALAMGQIHERLGQHAQADSYFARAAGLAGAPWDAPSVDPDIRADALRRLAVQRRRQRRHHEAAEAWRRLLDNDVPLAATQEARRALAIYYEHCARDLAAAREITERGLAAEQAPLEAEAWRHRLARLTRRLART